MFLYFDSFLKSNLEHTKTSIFEIFHSEEKSTK